MTVQSKETAHSEEGMSIKFIRSFLFVVSSLLVLNMPLTHLWGQEKPKGPPPANVAVSVIKSGKIAPQTEFIGTVFYEEVSDVASELSGLVEVVRFEEGQRVKKGQILIQLGSDLLEKRLRATTATYEQALSDLEIARIEFERREKLFKTKSISEQSYDENRFRVKGIEKRVSALKAEVERIEIELQKKNIRAPYEGVVIKREVDRGEWLAEGATVAILAKDDVIDVVADVSEKFIPYLKIGMPVKGTVNGKEITGSVIAIVPRGDVATRTFPVKIRTVNKLALIEGMSARVVLPTGKPQKTMVAPRDAVISVFGQTAVYAVKDSKAQMIPVNIIGYQDQFVGVEGQGLAVGMQVVVKGNERLRNGQMVSITLYENR
jgi:RND family efflux transporter MFP subunit